jgi:hypothetical protein
VPKSSTRSIHPRPLRSCTVFVNRASEKHGLLNDLPPTAQGHNVLRGIILSLARSRESAREGSRPLQRAPPEDPRQRDRVEQRKTGPVVPRLCPHPTKPYPNPIQTHPTPPNKSRNSLSEIANSCSPATQTAPLSLKTAPQGGCRMAGPPQRDPACGPADRGAPSRATLEVTRRAARASRPDSAGTVAARPAGTRQTAPARRRCTRSRPRT